MELLVHPGGLAEWRGESLRCAIGRSGVATEKREGDGATPAGVFGLQRILYRADRGGPPRTNLPVAQLTPRDGWCDAPDDASYNRQVVLPHGARCESLWREDRIYDLIAVTGYNDDPVEPGRGSAVFVHIARPEYQPTEGCVAFSKDDLRRILADWNDGDTVRVLSD